MTQPESKMFLLPPAADRCQECGTKHEPELPHNAQSMYYSVAFQMQHGRAPTWLDAMAHCSDEMKLAVRGALIRAGVDVDAGEVNPKRREASHG